MGSIDEHRSVRIPPKARFFSLLAYASPLNLIDSLPLPSSPSLTSLAPSPLIDLPHPLPLTLLEHLSLSFSHTPLLRTRVPVSHQLVKHQ